MHPDLDPTLLAPLGAATRLGLVTDFDGTLSPIVPRPEDAQPTAANRAHLGALAARLTLTAVMTGRSAEDAYQRLGVPGVLVVGNHGLERWESGELSILPDAAHFRPRIQAAAGELAALLQPGMHIENKGLTLSVHYRQASDPESIQYTLAAPLAALAQRHGLACHTGRRVFELRPPLAVDKGSALTALVAEYELNGVIYLGDDVTDAAALSAARELRAAGQCYGLALGVASEATPPEVRDQADALLPGVSGVEAFLGWLRMSVSASST